MMQIPDGIMIKKSDIKKFFNDTNAFKKEYYDRIMSVSDMMQKGEKISGDDMQMFISCAIAGVFEVIKAQALVRGLLTTPPYRLLDDIDIFSDE